MVILAFPMTLNRSSSVSFGVTAPFPWVLVHAKHFLCVPSRSGVSVFPSLVEVHLVAASLSFWMWDIFLSFFLSFFLFGGFCILLSKFVWQIAVIWGLFQEKMSTCSSPPSF